MNDGQKMLSRLVAVNMVLTVVLLILVAYMMSIIIDPLKKIDQLTKLVNELVKNDAEIL